ncbi:hypothetical protein J4212_02750 [Candidatus Woesearchaeota archaeon]|nr:hypothetical protein [Candidatus Woesearchaeota archaeon]
MAKKAQAAIFIILGIVILIVGSLLFYTNSLSVEDAKQDAQTANEVPLQLEPINGFFESCLKEAAEEAVVLAGFQGGFVEPIAGFPLLKASFSDIHMWKYEESKLYSPILKNLAANQISIYVGNKIPQCAASVKKQFPFAEFGSNADAVTTIGQDEVSTSILYDISIKSGGDTFTKSQHLIKVPVRLGYIMDSAEKIIDRQIEDVDKVDLAYLSSFDFSASAIMSDDEEVMFKIVDVKSKIGGEPYIFLFAEKYNLAQTGNDYAPMLQLIGDVNAAVGQPFSMKVGASDTNEDIVKFSSSSDLFDISSDGTISFTPASQDIGLHFATITVEDSQGLQDTQVMKIEVA